VEERVGERRILFRLGFMRRLPAVRCPASWSTTATADIMGRFGLAAAIRHGQLGGLARE
jgi:hypothetical protein